MRKISLANRRNVIWHNENYQEKKLKTSVIRSIYSALNDMLFFFLLFFLFLNLIRIKLIFDLNNQGLEIFK